LEALPQYIIYLTAAMRTLFPQGLSQPPLLSVLLVVLGWFKASSSLFTSLNGTCPQW